MRSTIAVVAALFASCLASESKAQYVPGYDTQGAAPAYTYIYPARPSYVRGYQTVAQPSPYPYQYQYARPANPTGYRNRPYYGAYGYGNNSNGSIDGFPPFRGWRRPEVRVGTLR